MNAMQMSVAALAAFATEVRPDWDPSAITGAIAAAQRAGWQWKRILTEVTRMIADDNAHPRELLDAVRNPVEPPIPADPDANERGAREARRLLAEVLGGES